MRKLLAILFFFTPVVAMASVCQIDLVNPLDGFEATGAELYADLPDSNTFTAVAPIEQSLLQQTYGAETPWLSKRWCHIGIQSFVVEFEVPLLDDSLAAQIIRAVYVWDATGDIIGWRLAEVGQVYRCARGNDPFATICP